MAKEQFTQEQMSIFAENLKRLIQQKGVDQGTVADAIGISRAMMSYYVTAKKYPRLKNMLKLQEYFGVDLDTLRNPYIPDAVSAKRREIYNFVATIPEQYLEAVLQNLKSMEIFWIMGLDIESRK